MTSIEPAALLIHHRHRTLNKHVFGCSIRVQSLFIPSSSTPYAMREVRNPFDIKIKILPSATKGKRLANALFIPRRFQSQRNKHERESFQITIRFVEKMKTKGLLIPGNCCYCKKKIISSKSYQKAPSSPKSYKTAHTLFES